ncbi:immune-responsive protein 1 [Photobacterium aphoticum]|uniref:Immune-responsive protein 1 n=1 Tax=Photobacterium aphoticum TaxID=754436 RepID=A0A090QMG2_9GAMM|nr:immune-responsive protein 1 [Photobacterium aphoticum]
MIGIFGAVIAAAKVLKVDAHTLSHALAIAASMASGVRGNFGSQTKALHAGMAAFNGINALELAQLVSPVVSMCWKMPMALRRVLLA